MSLEEVVDSMSSPNLTPRVSYNCATIHDLPTEILVRIFCAATEFRYSNLTLADATRALLSLSRVSRYWRAVVFSIPEVWGRLINITDLSEGQVLQFIERSNSTPIELFLDGGSHSQPGIQQRGTRDRFSRVLLELNRISYLVIRQFHLTGDHFYRMSRPAPSLDLFSFEGHGPDPVRFPLPLFDNSAPRLRSLRLSSALIDFDQALYPSLRELSVHDTQDPFSPSTSIWLNFLARHTFLTSLNLAYAISDRFSDTSEWLPTVTFPRLQELALTDEATPCAYLIAKILVPTSCRISVIAALDNHSGAQLLQAAYSALVSKRVGADLQVTMTGTSVAFTDTIDEPKSSSPQRFRFFFKFQWQASFDPFEELHFPHNPIDFLPDALLTNVENLRIVLIPIDGRYPLDDTALLSVFDEWLGRLTSVKHLTLDSCSLDALLNLLSNCGSDSDSSENDGDGDKLLSPSLPSLCGLEIVQTKGEEIDWEALLSYGEWRANVQKSIRYIVVPESEVNRLGWKDGSSLAELDVELRLK